MWYDKCVVSVEAFECEYLGKFEKGWYWLDETWNLNGPYRDRDHALNELLLYLAYLEKGITLDKIYVRYYKYLKVYYWKKTFWWFRLFGYGVHFMRRNDGRYMVTWLR